jgi:DNA-binding FadR family transcriptional regulator
VAETGELATGLVDAPKLASVVARRLEDEIASLGWPKGEVLGAEADLVASFGVSRAVFREAVRIVEHTGAASMRRGPGGGLVVGEPSVDAVSMAAGIWISYAGVTVDHMFDVRRPVLMAAVRLAAERRGEDDVDAMRASLDSHRDVDFLPSDMIDLEVQIARTSGNPVYELFVRVLGDLGVSQMESGQATLDASVGVADRLRHLDGYAGLVDLIAEGDVSGAAEQMDRLIAAARRRVTPATRRRRPRTRAALPAGGKLAEQVAAAIRHDIEGAGWPIGEVLGSEVELIDRYEVSRAILREGVRILEHHGAVRTKRGPNGGVIVAVPDIRAIVRSARLVLEHRGVSRGDLDDARSTLEVAAARRATARGDDAALDDLAAGLAREAPDRRFDFYDIHRRIAAATGNPAFTLFTDVMTDLVPSYVAPRFRTPVGETELAEVVHRAHAGIVKAIREGDSEAAARRMGRHIHASAAVMVNGPDRDR